ncbi:hypothetical protein BU14_0081s0022 [Porphyra umbilicalis]|uniref:Major facilitator superfamily associated domain-containing protein n=1 Tax=Porphyra umbilicalis TaxID=2786 RepID=A0A1X6PF86_PORUM|nr:hypothetical protein BU14_0081s0022 [Porphyra umbilicalis]|eukprot:OSX79343.1 hypothetical protein BU14_0081s0022 [Porphyra umbilicalis]
MLLVAMAAYVTRVAAYTLITDPRYVLLVEPLHGITYTLTQLATVAEMTALAPPHLQATSQSYLAVARTVGTIVGTVGGSQVMQRAGPAVAYTSAGGLVALTAVAYAAAAATFERRVGGGGDPRRGGGAAEEADGGGRTRRPGGTRGGGGAASSPPPVACAGW